MAIHSKSAQVLSKRQEFLYINPERDAVPFQGSDSREFWQRAEERNASTATLYSRLGLPKYAGIEAFVRYVPCQVSLPSGCTARTTGGEHQ